MSLKVIITHTHLLFKNKQDFLKYHPYIFFLTKWNLFQIKAVFLYIKTENLLKYQSILQEKCKQPLQILQQIILWHALYKVWGRYLIKFEVNFKLWIETPNFNEITSYISIIRHKIKLKKLIILKVQIMAQYVCKEM